MTTRERWLIREPGATIAPIEARKPWQSGGSESCDGTFRRGCLDAEPNVSPMRMV